MNPGHFLAELKRRNVYKVAVAYIVPGWAAAQGLARVLPVFSVPVWVIQLLVVLIVIGLPFGLALAWAFELTPEGIKRTEVLDVNEPHAVHGPWIYVALIAAEVSVSGFVLGRYAASDR